MDYEAGLNKLKQLAQGTDWLHEFTIYEARLLENIHDERLYGSNAQFTSTRNQIIAQLNRLAMQRLSISFNDLCMEKTTPSKQTATGQQAWRPEEPPDIFISYHDRDQRYLNELRTFLEPYVKRGILQYWDRTKIVPGTRWAVETENALRRATIAIILVSADYLASDERMLRELPMLLEEQGHGKTILLVIVRPCDLQGSGLEPFAPINSLEMPLSAMKSVQREELWVKLVNLAKRQKG